MVNGHGLVWIGHYFPMNLPPNTSPHWWCACLSFVLNQTFQASTSACVQAEYAKWFWASPDIFSCEPWVPCRISSDIFNIQTGIFVKHKTIKVLLKCPTRCNFFTGHFAQFPRTRQNARWEFTPSLDIWNVPVWQISRTLCPPIATVLF